MFIRLMPSSSGNFSSFAPFLHQANCGGASGARWHRNRRFLAIFVSRCPRRAKQPVTRLDVFAHFYLMIKEPAEECSRPDGIILYDPNFRNSRWLDLH